MSPEDPDRRLRSHPVLAIPQRELVHIRWRGRDLAAVSGEPISSALAAHGARVLGHHPKDGSARSLFCADGQCAQCLVLCDGRPVKACVTRVRDGAVVEPLDGLPVLAPAGAPSQSAPIEHVSVPVLIIGGGPAGLAAAAELGRRGVRALLLDDKPQLGGKLVLQTHRFFGSFNAVHAGVRGIDIAARLEREARAFESITFWIGATALAVFGDGVVGVLRAAREGQRDAPSDAGGYALVRPEVLLVATGARERSLVFPGNTLPGVIGAGAFQTLLHRDLVRPADRVLVVGGGNVGLIVAYQALQAGIEVVAVVEARRECGGYRVHRDKLARQGVPILTAHTIVAAHGTEGVEAATVASVDARFACVPGTERTFACDAVLLALGMDPERELLLKAREMGMRVLSAGDADEVAEASAAIYAGRLRGVEAARLVGVEPGDAPVDAWQHALEIHRSRPGATLSQPDPPEHDVVPVLHCVQEIPCDPCASTCPQGGIVIDADDIRHLPAFLGDRLAHACVGCERCVTICPGQAITLVDYRRDPEHPTVIVPYEMPDELAAGARVIALDVDGHVLGEVEVVRVRDAIVADHTLAVRVRVPRVIARYVAGIRATAWPTEAEPGVHDAWPAGRAVVCRCERVTADELRALVRAGHRDVHSLKVLSRIGMGACGARTCGPLVRQLLRDEGVAEDEVVEPRHRPLLVEVPLGAFAGPRVERR